mgnify:CR=1 FL=1|jgi:hypothetical protein
MEKNYLVGWAFLFVTNYSRSNSLFTAFLISCTATLFLAISAAIWRSKSNIVIRSGLILAFACLIGGIIYISVKLEADYRARKQIQHMLSTEDMNGLRQAYQDRKEIDIKKTAIEISDRLKKHGVKQDDNIDIHRWIDELRYVNNRLENPFITNECDATDLADIREYILEVLEIYGKNAPPEFIENIHKIKNLSQFYIKFSCDPVQVESYKILLEKGPRQFVKFFEQLLETKEGLIKIKKIAALKDGSTPILKFLINDKDTFEEEAMRLLLASPQDTRQIFSDIDVQQYIKKYFVEFIHTIDGREKIIQDIQKLNKVGIIYIETLCKIVEENHYIFPTSESDNLVKERVGSKINDLIQTIGKVYE